jgi:hypothetical protein
VSGKASLDAGAAREQAPAPPSSRVVWLPRHGDQAHELDSLQRTFTTGGIGSNLSHWLLAKLTRNIVRFPEIRSFLYNRGHASWNGQTGRCRAIRGGNGGRHSRCGFRVLRKPILGTADSERWRCLGVRSFLFVEIPQESMNKARQRLYYAANRADAIRTRAKISLPDSCRSPKCA